MLAFNASFDGLIRTSNSLCANAPQLVNSRIKPLVTLPGNFIAADATRAEEKLSTQTILKSLR
jgi:hypothetical protein